MVVLHPGIPHQRIFLIVERIENLDGIQAPDSLDPDKRNRLLQRNDAPVARVVGDDRTQVVFAIHKLDTRLDVVLMVDPQHQSGLVVTGPIIARHLYLHLKFATTEGIEEGRIIHRKSIVRNAPVVRLRRHLHRKHMILNSPLSRFVEPLHLLQRLSLTVGGRTQTGSRHQQGTTHKLFHIYRFFIYLCKGRTGKQALQ